MAELMFLQLLESVTSLCRMKNCLHLLMLFMTLTLIAVGSLLAHLRSGKVVFGTVDIPRTMVLDPQGANDQTKLYLIVWTSHDGSVAVQAAVTPVRVVCQNTLNLAMRNAKQSFKIRHTQSVEGRIQVARETLGLALGYFDEFEKEAQGLFNQAITDAQFSELDQNNLS
jgi:hypothetical protein